MAELIVDCPRCNAREITFDLKAFAKAGKRGWQQGYELFGVCRGCERSTIFQTGLLSGVQSNTFEGAMTQPLVVNTQIEILGYVSLKDKATVPPPEHLPANIASAFTEGAICYSVSCWNAAGAMFRLCVDLATKSMLPEGDVKGLASRHRNYLASRLKWLIDNGQLPPELSDLSTCIKDDGNDGVHDGSLGQVDAGDLQDFTSLLLTRLYTEPAKLKLAKERRKARRS